ncbi:MAG: DUF2791 family P-loop domain-containing protein, partial [Lachnospiraceae bacterium]|nr:DUF2791 family P-loop domain-containing protein [Lachnospiraceae bacterium]
MDEHKKVPKRISQTVLNSLKGGVVPRIGLPYITVGRKSEIEALLHDVDIIAEGGASFRFIVGRYGSGKSFLLQTIRNNVMDRGFAVMDADLSPERRLQGTRGQGLATYRELISNLATKTRPEGGALTLVLDRWINAVQSAVQERTGLDVSAPSFPDKVGKMIREVISALGEMVHGFDFARLLTLYYKAHLSGDDETKA